MALDPTTVFALGIGVMVALGFALIALTAAYAYGLVRL